MKAFKVIKSVGELNRIFPMFLFLISVVPVFATRVENDNRINQLIEAERLYREYSMNQVNYNSRQLPLDMPYPSNREEWSGEMFKTRIFNLVDSATNDLSGIKDENIAGIDSLVTGDSLAARYGLSLADFIAFKGCAILKNFARDNSMSIIPFYPNETDETIEGKCKSLAKKILKEVIDDLSGDNTIIKAVAVSSYLPLVSVEESENFLNKWLMTLRGTEGEGILLYEFWQRFGKPDKDIYQAIKNWLDKYPEGYYSQQLKYVESLICQQKTELQFPSVSLPSVPIKGELTITNMNKGFLLIYKLSAGQFTQYDELILKKFNIHSKPVKIIEFEARGEIPFSEAQEVEIDGLPEGLYIVVPTHKTILPNNWNKTTSRANYSTIRVTDIAILTTGDSNQKDSGKAYVVKGKDQQPVKGAVVSYQQTTPGSQFKKLLTNEEGWVNIPDGYYRLEASYGKSVTKREAGFNYYPDNSAIIRHASILTDLKVYRPGDTVRFSVVGWQQEKLKTTLLMNQKADVILRDANFIEVGKIQLTLDTNGRSNGCIRIPEGRLLGNYNLTVNYPEFQGSGAGYADITVEEYKLPAFLVTLDRSSDSNDGNINFKGKAISFAGQPVNDADVEIKIEFVPWRFGYFGNNAKYSCSLKTDNKGEFILSLPTSGLKGTIFENGRYSITSQVTSLAGETEKSKPLVFYLGKGLEVRAAIREKTEIKGDNIELNIPVQDMAGMVINTIVEYKLTNVTLPEIVRSGSFISPSLKISADSLPSGKYKFEFKISPEGEWTTVESVLWRPEDNTAPYPTALWVPENQYVYSKKDRYVTVKFGSYWKDWLLYILSDGKKEIKRNWILPSDTLTHLDIDIPQETSTLFLTISGMHDFNSATSTIKIISKESLEKMEILTESFRNKLAAGDQETWKFRFKIGESLPGIVNAFAVMSDKALNSIRDFKWGLGIWHPNVYDKITVSPPHRWYNNSFKYFTDLKNVTSQQTSLIPEWEGSLFPYYEIRTREVMYKSMATVNASSDFATGKIEMAEDSEESVSEPPQEENKSEETEYLRPIEKPVAFFMPDLESNEEGEITVNFIVPDFNTTWQFQLAGYNEKLENATLLLDATVSKPVMVKTNLPQFLRTGDKAELSATIYNGSDKEMNIGGRISILNPFNGLLLVDKNFDTISLLPSESRVVTIKFDVPDDLNIIAVKSYAFGESHTDGEQGYVVILPSSTPVTDATTFYATSKDNTIELKLPKLNKEANVTLKYCDNPLWEVLLALPGFKENSGGGVLSIARWLYATLTSADVIERNPSIRKGICQILGAEDSTLSLSNLQKDPNLKIKDLEATPWINNALGETARIRSLENYFNKEKIESQISLKIKELGAFQKRDGGFSWFEGMKSSPYITSEVINIFGYLNHQDILNPSLRSMALRSVNYYDNHILELYNKKKELNPIIFLSYFYSRNLMGIKLTPKIKKIESQCLDSLVSHIFNYNLNDITRGALILIDRPEYQKDLDKIAVFLKQRDLKKLSLGQKSLLLEFFVKFEPAGDFTNKLIETIFLQKETMDWGSNIMTAGLIHTLINLTGKEQQNRPQPQIWIDDKKIEILNNQIPTGNYTINLNAKDVSGKKLVIKRTQGIPAWGGIISQYILPIQDVKASKVENLAIEKRVFIEDDKGKVKQTDKLNQGDKLRITLNLSCGKDMDYVVITDSRSSCFQPDDKLSGMTWIDGLSLYKETGQEKTSFFIEHLPAGNYVISYDCHVDREGEYSLGIAETQSLYSPAQVSHSSGKLIKIGNGE